MVARTEQTQLRVFPVECAAELQGSNNGLDGIEDSLHGYSSSAVFECGIGFQ